MTERADIITTTMTTTMIANIRTGRNKSEPSKLTTLPDRQTVERRVEHLRTEKRMITISRVAGQPTTTARKLPPYIRFMEKETNGPVLGSSIKLACSDC